MYQLSLHRTDSGRFVVYRYEWAEFPLPGEWILTEPRAVSGAFRNRERTRRFACEYVGRHPGHTRDPLTLATDQGAVA